MSDATSGPGRMRAGSIEWELVTDGTFRLDGGAMFGVVPKPLWQKRTVPDERNRITLGLNAMLIRTGEAIVLVDVGAGRKEDERFAELYGLGRETDLVASLAERGVAPEDVDVVVLTHLHFDHAGGSTYRGEDGEVRPRFPNARHFVSARELQDARKPTARSKASYFPDNWEPLVRAKLLEPFHGPELEPVDGVRLSVLKGHVRALSGVVIESGDARVWFPSDNMPTSMHVPGPWVMGYDLYPLDTLAFKESFLESAADEAWTVVFQHDPVVGAGRIHRAKRGWEVETLLDAPTFAFPAVTARGGDSPR